MIKIILISLLLCCVTAFGQSNQEIDQMELVKELQIWIKKENKMSFSFWIPQSYWRIALKDNSAISNETISLIEETFRDYTMLCVTDMSISAKPTFIFKDEAVLRSEIRLIDFEGHEHLPIPNERLSSDIKAIMASITPVFIQMFGKMGEGMHFYLFKNTDSKNRRLINETEKGGFTVKHSNNEFKWTLPLVSMLPEKYCPIDQGIMKGNWKYCPIHGAELD
jgi:hypothetical protein